MCAGEVGGEFGAAHVVEDLFALFQALVAVDVLGSEAAVETHVAVVLKDGVVEHFGEVPAEPAFIACMVGAADGLEWGDLLAHGFIRLFVDRG